MVPLARFIVPLCFHETFLILASVAAEDEKRLRESAATRAGYRYLYDDFRDESSMTSSIGCRCIVHRLQPESNF
jgi:uncharacterized protein with gpF-like domain